MMWTPMIPLTDAYALRGVARYRPRLRTVAAVGLGGLRASARSPAGYLVDPIARAS